MFEKFKSARLDYVTVCAGVAIVFGVLVILRGSEVNRLRAEIAHRRSVR